MTAPTITQLPLPSPSRGDSPSTFSTRADNTVAAWPTMITEQNTMASWMDTTATQVAVDAATASNAATVAAGNSNFVGNWADQTGALNVPASVYHKEVVWLLVNDLADVTASEPGVTSDWVRNSGYNVRITSTSLTAASGDFIVVQAAGQTITLPPSPIVGSTVLIKNDGAFADTVVGRNGLNIETTADDMQLDSYYSTYVFKYVGTTEGWVL